MNADVEQLKQIIFRLTKDHLKIKLQYIDPYSENEKMFMRLDGKTREPIEVAMPLLNRMNGTNNFVVSQK